MSALLLFLPQFFHRRDGPIYKYSIYISTRTCCNYLTFLSTTNSRKHSSQAIVCDRTAEHSTDLQTVILSSFEQRHPWETQRCASTVPITSLHKHTVQLLSGKRCAQACYEHLQFFSGEKSVLNICLSCQTVTSSCCSDESEKASRKKEAWKHWTFMLSLPFQPNWAYFH